MANPRIVKRYPITFTNHAGTYYSAPIFAGDFRDIVLTIVGTGVVAVLGSADVPTPPNPPDFTATSTITNSWIPQVIADLRAANTYATSLTISSSTAMGEVNTNLLTWICVTASTSTVAAFITVSDNS
jgi:hypothetical protein